MSEWFYAKLKQFRRIATSYDKHLVNDIGFVKLAAIVISLIWLTCYYALNVSRPEPSSPEFQTGQIHDNVAHCANPVVLGFEDSPFDLDLLQDKDRWLKYKASKMKLSELGRDRVVKPQPLEMGYNQPDAVSTQLINSAPSNIIQDNIMVLIRLEQSICSPTAPPLYPACRELVATSLPSPGQRAAC